jgi:hypothetical protein
LALLCCTAASFGAGPTPDAQYVIPDKAEQPVTGLPDPIYIGVGGDTMASATLIVGLPYSDGGNTCSYVNDYDVACPYTGSVSRDVVYKYTPPVDQLIDINLCPSGYDTKGYVFEDTLYNTIACNDDTPGCGPDGYRSLLECVPVRTGHTYYIVVDGYGGACGTYVIDVSECVPCLEVPCPPGALAEGEVDCYVDYDDVYNGGCNSVPPVFTNIPCDTDGGGMTICGTYGVYDHYSGFTYRDTDWYHLNPAWNDGDVVWCVTGLYGTLTGYIDATAGCPAAFLDALFSNPCDTVCYNLPAGDLWLFVSTDDWLPEYVCGGNYVMTLEGYDCGTVSVEAEAWSKIKADYR